jgi:hypothetical protein
MNFDEIYQLLILGMILGYGGREEEDGCLLGCSVV